MVEQHLDVAVFKVANKLLRTWTRMRSSASLMSNGSESSLDRALAVFNYRSQGSMEMTHDQMEPMLKSLKDRQKVFITSKYSSVRESIDHREFTKHN